MSSPTPIPPILPYAPASPSLRLWPLAIGTALLSVATANFPLFNVWRRHFGLSLPAQFLCGAAVDLLFPLAIFAAILLLSRALPPRPAAKFRWTVIAPILFGGVYFLVCAASATDLLVLADQSVHHHAFWRSHIFRTIGGIQIALQAALLVSIALFFIAAASRARHPALGIIAACAVIPDTLFLIVDSAQMFTDFLDTAPWLVLRAYLIARNLQFYCLILLFFTVALFAAALALTHRRTNIINRDVSI